MTFIKNLRVLFFFILAAVAVTACNEDSNPFTIDYSDAPPLADTTKALSKTISETGLIYYVINEGDQESFEVVIRDQILVYYTTRQTDGDIVGSSYANGSTTPTRVLTVGAQNSINFVGQGFTEGVLGMKEGERRVLVIPEELNTTSETLVLDVELETIEY